MKKVLHVHRADLREGLPAIIVRSYKRSTHHRTVEIQGPCKIIHSPVPDSCGARVWIETSSPVLADGKILID